MAIIENVAKNFNPGSKMYEDFDLDFELGFNDEDDDFLTSRTSTPAFDSTANVDDNFSQLLVKKKRAPPRKRPVTLPATLDDFEEAFTAINCIRKAHEESFSTTAINALLHFKRGADTTKRTAEGLTWPEHPQTFSASRLIVGLQNYTENEIAHDTRQVEPIPQFYTCDSESDSSETESNTTPLCEMEQNPNLHSALLRTCQSIYRQKTENNRELVSTLDLSAEIDPHLSHVIARRCSTLLQQVFSRALLTRRSAIKLLRLNGQSRNTDVDNVPVNWEDAREAARQLVGKAEIDFDLFLKVSARLTRTFTKKQYKD